jgi:hypothetical protein
VPNPNNAIRRQQWSSCERCGRLFPMSSLVKQKGLMVCTAPLGCFDNLEVERRGVTIERVMNPGSAQDQEGVDTRAVDRGFFDNFDDQTF